MIVIQKIIDLHFMIFNLENFALMIQLEKKDYFLQEQKHLFLVIKQLSNTQFYVWGTVVSPLHALTQLIVTTALWGLSLPPSCRCKNKMQKD